MANYLAPPSKNALSTASMAEFMTPEGRARMASALGSSLYNMFVQPVSDAYNFSSQAMTGQIPMYAADENGRITINPQMVEGALNTAMTAGTSAGAIGAKQALKEGYNPSVVNMFAGPSAKTANLAALKTAQEMAAKGATPEAIHDATKWFQGADGKWRFEIPDTNMSISKAQEDALYNARRREPTTLGNVLSHPELFAAYPHLADLPAATTRFVSEASMGPEGLKVNPKLFSADVTHDDFKSVLAHEAQHAVQDVENFAAGGNPIHSIGLDADALWKEQQADTKALDDLWMSDRRNTKKYRAELDEIQQRIKQRSILMNKIDDLGPYRGYADLNIPTPASDAYYRRLAGEVEARNVQKRLTEGYAKYPWETQDVPNADQFIRNALIKGPR